MPSSMNKKQKMSEPWLIFDVPYLAHRIDYAMGELEHDGRNTAILFGLMRDVTVWSEMFSTRRFVFCFDVGWNKRIKIYQQYKQNRKPKEDETEEEREARRRFREQVRLLREEDLYKLGYRNVLWEDGYEADDIMASICLFSLMKGEQAIVVTSDADLLQVISPDVSVFDPRSGRRKTQQWFTQQYGVSPCQWADVKAMAGCSSDNVRGIEGVGEKSALSYLTGKMNVKHKRFQSIITGSDRWERNLRLVQLPFEGCPRFKLREDQTTRKRWERMCDRWGMSSLRRLYVGR